MGGTLLTLYTKAAMARALIALSKSTDLLLPMTSPQWNRGGASSKYFLKKNKNKNIPHYIIQLH